MDFFSFHGDLFKLFLYSALAAAFSFFYMATYILQNIKSIDSISIFVSHIVGNTFPAPGCAVQAAPVPCHYLKENYCHMVCFMSVNQLTAVQLMFFFLQIAGCNRSTLLMWLTDLSLFHSLFFFFTQHPLKSWSIQTWLICQVVALRIAHLCLYEVEGCCALHPFRLIWNDVCCRCSLYNQSHVNVIFHKQSTKYNVALSFVFLFYFNLFLLSFFFFIVYPWQPGIAISHKVSLVSAGNRKRHLLWRSFSKICWSEYCGYVASQSCSLSVSLSFSWYKNTWLLHDTLGLICLFWSLADNRIILFILVGSLLETDIYLFFP